MMYNHAILQRNYSTIYLVHIAEMHYKSLQLTNYVDPNLNEHGFSDNTFIKNDNISNKGL